MQISDHLDIIAIFKAEFAHISDRFEVYFQSIKETREAKDTDLPISANQVAISTTYLQIIK